MSVSTEVARCRGRVAGYKRAVRNGERAANDPAVTEAERELAVAVLASHATKVVANWPKLTDAQRDRIAAILAGGVA